MDRLNLVPCATKKTISLLHRIQVRLVNESEDNRGGALK